MAIKSDPVVPEVACGEMHYAFDLILWGDGEVGACCVIRNHFQYVTNKEGFDNLQVDELKDVFNGLLMIHDKTILFLEP